jgi:hypothetical protein
MGGAQPARATASRRAARIWIMVTVQPRAVKRTQSNVW